MALRIIRLEIWFVLFAILFASNYTMAQNNFIAEWLVHPASEDWEIINYMVKDSSDNIYVAGNFSKKLSDKTSNVELNSKREIFVASYNKKGEKQWIQKITSSEYCSVSSMIKGRDRSFYVCGYFKGKMGLCTDTLIAPGKPDIFFSKINDNGEIEWVKHFKGYFEGKKVLLGIDLNNNPSITFIYKGNLISDNKIIGTNPTGIMVSEFNADGELINRIDILGSSDCLLNEFYIDSNRYYFTGSFQNKLTIIDTTLYSKGRFDAFFVIINKEKDIEFVTQIGSSYDDFGTNIICDNDTDYILTGTFSNIIEFNDAIKINTNGGRDVFIVKCNQNGKIKWADCFGGMANENLCDTKLNHGSDIILLGNYCNVIEKQSLKTKSNGSLNDIFISKYKSDGTLKYLESIGDTNTEFAKSIEVIDENSYIISGNFDHFIEIQGFESDSINDCNYFLTKLYDCDNNKKVKLPNDTSLCNNDFILIVDTGFVEYKWNGITSGNRFTVDTTGLYIIETIDGRNCISMDSIYVRINPLPEPFLGNDIEIRKGEYVLLSPGRQYSNYLWTTNDTLSELFFLTDNIQPGEYQIGVQVIDTNRCLNTDDVKITIVDQDELPLSVSAYPNPTRDKITINIENFKSDEEFELLIMSSDGKVLFKELFFSNSSFFENTINVDKFPKGTYIIKFKHSSGVEKLKFVKL